MNLMMILRQLWNQRAANGWILGELVVVTYFLWGVVDPVYVLLSDKALPDNYDLTDTYLLCFSCLWLAIRFLMRESSSCELKGLDM